MGRHQRPQQVRAGRDPQYRPRFGLAPLILAGAIVISYAVVRVSGGSTLMFTPPARPPAISGIHPTHGPASPPTHTPAAEATPSSRTPQPGTGGGVSVACQFTSGVVCGVSFGGQATPGTPASGSIKPGAP
jgi:hypothetical protein